MGQAANGTNEQQCHLPLLGEGRQLGPTRDTDNGDDGCVLGVLLSSFPGMSKQSNRYQERQTAGQQRKERKVTTYSFRM